MERENSFPELKASVFASSPREGAQPPVLLTCYLACATLTIQLIMEEGDLITP